MMPISYIKKIYTRLGEHCNLLIPRVRKITDLLQFLGAISWEWISVYPGTDDGSVAD